MVSNRSEKRQLRFFVLGDFGSGDDVQSRVADAMVSAARREPPDFIIGTGDSVYPLPVNGASNPTLGNAVLGERFDRYYSRLGVEFFQCLGNEDLKEVFDGNPSPMVEHSWVSKVWRLPAAQYRIPNLPPWITIHVANTNVFGYQDCVAEPALFSEVGMNQQIDAIRESFATATGLRILVGHHPIFTAGKRTLRYNGDGEQLYMRKLRRAIEDCGVHFYLNGHEHHQSHITGPFCEHITQGCGGARQAPNPRHARRENGWHDDEKILRHLEVAAGFAIFEMNAALQVRVQFISVGANEKEPTTRVIYECAWDDFYSIGDPLLRGSAAPHSSTT